MTREDKQLLLIDLCARLPYGVKVNFRSNIEVLCEVHIYQSVQTVVGESGILYDADMPNVKPYLRPMSSMTEEEKEYIKNRWCYNDWDIDGPSSLWREKIDVEDAEGIIDYFNAHYLDYRGLIPMDLALEAKEGMYKTE